MVSQIGRVSLLVKVLFNQKEMAGFIKVAVVYRKVKVIRESSS